jgi:hypothetical protein
MGSGGSAAGDRVPVDIRRPPMIEEFKEVVLLRDLPREGLRTGDVGVIVEVFPRRDRAPAGYMVEFITLTGETVAVVDVTADAVRPVSDGDMPQARSMSGSRA